MILINKKLLAVIMVMVTIATVVALNLPEGKLAELREQFFAYNPSLENIDAENLGVTLDIYNGLIHKEVIATIHYTGGEGINYTPITTLNETNFNVNLVKNEKLSYQFNYTENITDYGKWTWDEYERCFIENATCQTARENYSRKITGYHDKPMSKWIEIEIDEGWIAGVKNKARKILWNSNEQLPDTIIRLKYEFDVPLVRNQTTERAGNMGTVWFNFGNNVYVDKTNSSDFAGSCGKYTPITAKYSEDVPNFVSYIVLNSSNLDYGSLDATPYHLWFSDSDNTTEIPTWIEHGWNGTVEGNIFAYLNLTSTNDYTFFAWYDCEGLDVLSGAYSTVYKGMDMFLSFESFEGIGGTNISSIYDNVTLGTPFSVLSAEDIDTGSTLAQRGNYSINFQDECILSTGYDIDFEALGQGAITFWWYPTTYVAWGDTVPFQIHKAGLMQQGFRGQTEGYISYFNPAGTYSPDNILSITLNQWHLVVARYGFENATSIDLSVYTDDTWYHTNMSVEDFGVINNIWIGCDDASHYAKGYMDEFTVYNTHLSDEYLNMMAQEEPNFIFGTPAAPLTIPIIDNMAINATPILESEDFSCWVNATDPNGDPMTATFMEYVNGVIQPDETDVQVVTSSNNANTLFDESTYGEGNNVTCMVNVSDGSNEVFRNMSLILPDFTAPVFYIISPEDKLYHPTTNISINWSVVEDNLALVEYCLANLTSTCVNITTATNLSGIQANATTNYLLMCATDNAANVGCASTLFDAFEVSDALYNATTAEFANENYYVNVTINVTRNALGSNFTWNAIDYTAATTTATGLWKYNISSTITIPVIQTTDASTNVSFYWNFTINHIPSSIISYSNTTAYPQNISVVQIDNCTNYSQRILNFTYWDEENNTRWVNSTELNNTYYFDAFFRIGQVPNNVKNLTFNLEADRGYFEICINTNATVEIDAEIEYWMDGYRKRIYQLLNRSTLIAGDNISLFGLHEAYAPAASAVRKIIVRDENGIGIEGVYVNARRYYYIDDEDKWLNMSWSVGTSPKGEATMELKESYRYLFEFWKDYKLLHSEEALTTSVDLYFTIIPPERYYKYGQARNLNYTLEFTNITNITTYTFNTIAIDEEDYNGSCLSISRTTTLGGKIIVCHVCSTIYSESSQTLECYTNNGTGKYMIQTTLTRRTTEIFRGSEFRSFNIAMLEFKIGVVAAYDYFRDGGLWVAIILFTTLALMALAAPSASILLGIIALVISVAMGIIELAWVSLASIIIVGLILVYKMGRKGI